MKIIFAVLVLSYLSYATAQELTITVPCSSHEECVSALYKTSTCELGVCTCDQECRQATKLDKGRRMNRIGNHCNGTQTCVVIKSSCVLNRCKCNEGYVSSEDKTNCLVAMEKLGDQCVENGQCASVKLGLLTECTGGKCTCKENTNDVKGKCWPKAGLQETCTAAEECAHIKFSDCKLEQCQCLDRFVPKMDGTVCLPKAAGFESSCMEGRQCLQALGEGGSCNNSTCGCADTYHRWGTNPQCIKDVPLGSGCQDHFQCHQLGEDMSAPRMDCILGVCKCRFGYREDSGFCVGAGTSPKHWSLIVLVSFWFVTKIVL